MANHPNRSGKFELVFAGSALPRILENVHGYYFNIGDVEHGHWRSKSEALGGRNVEINRQIAKAACDHAHP